VDASWRGDVGSTVRILGALATNWLRGLENDVYFQIGLLVLIGLGAKNAVLRVSAAVEFRKQGKTIMEATILAGEQRLRPIIMTSLAFAMGCCRSHSRWAPAPTRGTRSAPGSSAG